MKPGPPLLLTACLVMFSAAAGICGAEDLPVVVLRGRTMGSDYLVKLVDSKLGPEQLESLKADIENALLEANRQMSHYQADSELSRFATVPANTPFKISPAFARLMRFSLFLSRESGGAFDPTLGPLLNLWGFGEKTEQHVVPADGDLQAARAACGWRHVSVGERDELTKDIPGLALNLGAVAKGYGVDEMIRVLKGRGLSHLYASIAGEVRVLGHNPRGTKWQIGITAPVDHWRENDPMAAGLSLSDQALSTSGDYQKFFIDASGRRLCHILDPRTGRPVQNNVGSVSVVSGDNTTADGLATTLFVLGPDDGLKLIEKQANAAALYILREPDGSFKQIASSRFEALTGWRP